MCHDHKGASLPALLAVWSGHATSQAHGIAKLNAHNLLVARILQTAGGAEFFARHGVPDLAMLEKESAARRNLGGNSPAFHNPKWQTWINHNWNRTYAEWLLRHPVDAFRLPLSEATVLLAGFSNKSSARPVIPSPVQDGLWERTSSDVPLWFALISVAWLLSLGGSRPGRLRGGVPGSLDALGASIVAVSVLWYLAMLNRFVCQS